MASQVHPRIIKMIYALFGLCVAQVFIFPQVSHAYPVLQEWYVNKGCNIDYHKDLRLLFNDRDPNSGVTIDYQNYEAYKKYLAGRCREKANQAGCIWFALEYHGLCLCNEGPLDAYLKSINGTLHSKDSDVCVNPIEHKEIIISQKDGKPCVGGYYKAFFYEVKNVGAAAPAAAPEEEEEEEVVKCNEVADVVLVVDVSGSISDESFKLALKFLHKFVSRFDFSPGRSRIGIVSFDENCYVDLTWKRSSTLIVSAIQQVVDGIKHTGGSTRTDVALKCARDYIIRKNQRTNIPETLLILTDGYCWNGYTFLPEPSTDLRSMGVTTMAIGVGKEVDPGELQIITNNKDNIFLLSSFKNLLDHAATILNRLLKKACV